MENRSRRRPSLSGYIDGCRAKDKDLGSRQRFNDCPLGWLYRFCSLRIWDDGCDELYTGGIDGLSIVCHFLVQWTKNQAGLTFDDDDEPAMPLDFRRNNS
jgi:hypothetical protein